jgi:hypothetical protein
MKRILVVVLAFALTGCAAIAPALPTQGPTSTPQVIIQTVVVTVLVTVPPTETPIPSATWTPIPTFTPQPTSLTGTPGSPMGTGTAQTPQSSVSTSPTATLPADAGGGIFTNLTRSTDLFSYNCQPNTGNFGVSSTNTNITEVDFFYRLEDQSSSAITGWVDVSKMVSDNAGNFTFDFQAHFIPSDLRFRKAWFDYQFVALNKMGQVIGRSATIVKQVT